MICTDGLLFVAASAAEATAMKSSSMECIVERASMTITAVETGPLSASPRVVGLKASRIPDIMAMIPMIHGHSVVGPRSPHCR